MQTFLPYRSFSESAACLDMRRLGKQRVEGKQIIMALTGLSSGWTNHPATKMWRGYEGALVAYTSQVCTEWRRRGYRDSIGEWLGLLDIAPCAAPVWLTDDFCLAHRSNLVRKMPEHYAKLWPDVPDNLPYVWPV